MDRDQGNAQARERMARIKQLILDAPIGGYIGEEGADILSRHTGREVRLKDGEYLFRKGDETNSFFLVAEGRLARVKERKSSRKPFIVHVLEKGDLVGELAFIDGTAHSLSVVALGDISALQFSGDEMDSLIDEHPRVMFNFMRAVIKRVHHSLKNIVTQQVALSEYIVSGGKGRK